MKAQRLVLLFALLLCAAAALGQAPQSAQPALSCTSWWGSSKIDCFAHGQDNALWHRSFDAGGWRRWESLDGNLATWPSCVIWKSYRVDCFAASQDNAMIHLWRDGNRWRRWESLGGNIVGPPSCVSWGRDRGPWEESRRG